MVKGQGGKMQGVIRGFLVRRQMKHQWEIVESQRKYIASFLSDIEHKGETLMQFQHALNDHDEARNVERMFLDVAESEETKMSAVPEVPLPPPPPITNGIHKSDSAADSAYDTSQPPSPGKISTSTTEDDVFHETDSGASFMPPMPPPPLVIGESPLRVKGQGRGEEEDELADCGYVSMKDAPPGLKKSLKQGGVTTKQGEGAGEDSLPPPPPPMETHAACPGDIDADFPPPPPMAEIAGDTKDSIAAIRARFKQKEEKSMDEPPQITSSPPRKKLISLPSVSDDTAKTSPRQEVGASPTKTRIAERIAQLKEQEVASDRGSTRGPPGAVLMAGAVMPTIENEYVNRGVNDPSVKRRPPAPARDPNTRLTMIENTSVQRMSYGNGVQDIRMVRTRSEEYRVQSQYGRPGMYEDTLKADPDAYYGNVRYRDSMAEHTYGVIPDVPPPPLQAPPPPPPDTSYSSAMSAPGGPAVPPPPAHAPPPVPPTYPSGNTNNTNNIFMQIPGANSRPRSQVFVPESVPPPPCVAPPPPPQPPPVPSAPKPAHLSTPVMSAQSYAQPPPPPNLPGFAPPPPPPPSGMGAMVPPAPPAPNAPPPPPPPAFSKPAGGLLDGITGVQLKSASKVHDNNNKKKPSQSDDSMGNLMAELQSFTGRLRPTPKQAKPAPAVEQDEPDNSNGISQFNLKPAKTNGAQAQPPSPPQHHNSNNSTNGYRLSPTGGGTNGGGPPPTMPKSPKAIPMTMPKPSKAPAAIPSSPSMAPPAPPSVPQKKFSPPPSPPQKAPIAPPKKADYNKRISMPVEMRPLSPTAASAVAERQRKVSAPAIAVATTVQLPEGYDNMPAWKKAMVDKKLKEAMAKEEEERRKLEEEQAKWQGVPEWKRKLMQEKEKKKTEEIEATVDKTQQEREVKLRSMPTWKRNIVKKKLGTDEGGPGASGFEETSTAL